MPAIPLGLSSYERADLAPLLLANYFFETAPTNLEDQVALIPRPRTRLFSTVSDGPINGLYRKGGVIFGRILVLSGNDLYRVEQSGQDAPGTPTLIDTVEGVNRMSAEGNSSLVVLTRGTKAYHTDGTTLTEIALPDSFNCLAVDTLNSYFLFVRGASGRFYWSAIGGTTVDALDYATAESQPDVLITLKVLGDELWLMGRLSIEVWQPTGDTDLPFQRIGGRIFGIGCTARDTVRKLNVGGNDTMCWVGTDRRVYRTDPNPVKISDNSIDEKLQISDPNELYAVDWSWNGHDFYVLHIPGHGSFAYDLQTKRWGEVSSYGRDLFRGQVSAVGPNNQPLLGDDDNGTVWELTDQVRADGDDPVGFEFSGLLEVNGSATRCNNVLLDCTTGLTPDPENDPMILMQWSDDKGQTWSDWRIQPLGRQGERSKRVMWSRLGLLKRPGRLFRWRTTEPITARKAKYNEAYK
jgi:hypothetical protein